MSKPKTVEFTKDMAKRSAIWTVDAFVLQAMESDLMSRREMHIVVGRSDGTILYECSIGDPSNWEYDYQDIALAKFADTVLTQRSGREVQALTPELATGRTPYWGSFIDGGIVVSASGVQPWWDQATCAMIAAFARGLISELQQELAAKR